MPESKEENSWPDDAAILLRAPREDCFVDVLVAAPVAGRFTYRWIEETPPIAGQIVEVPFGRRQELGVVTGKSAGRGRLAPDKLKPIARVFDIPPQSAALTKFVERVARYACAPEGYVERLVLRVPEALDPPEPQLMLASGPPDAWPQRLTPARRRVKDALEPELCLAPKDLAAKAEVSPGVIRDLIAQGALELREVRVDDFAPPLKTGLGPPLAGAQRAAAEALIRAVEARAYAAFFLDGVTGSGKTEVYFAAIEAAIRTGGSALVLLPEIALTQQILQRFEARFGAKPFEWHSQVSRPRRRETWRAIAEGKAGVVIGARSALFLPYKDLRLIIVDEEHDASYKQDDGLAYQARDMALLRAHLESLPIVLASATPSLETEINTRQGRFTRLQLPARHGAAKLPAVRAIDLRHAPPERGRWLSPPLTAAITETLAKGEQSLLFLNRRGYAPLTICRACGHRMMSPHASTWLVEHRFQNRLVCHVTGFSMPKPDACPACGVKESLVPCGPGVERIAEEVRALFPNARLGLVSSDLFHGPKSTQEIFDAVAAGRIDILIGTQIVAKGHHFPNLTLVGVVDADLGLSGGDLRAAERTFQLLHQVGGRAGRAERPGMVLLQTYMPEHNVMRALTGGSRDAFLTEEAAAREAAMMPPFARLAALILEGPSEGDLMSAGRTLIAAAPGAGEVTIWGPAPAPIALVRGRHRVRLLVRAPKAFNLSSYIAAWTGAIRPPSAIRLLIDIDPYHFL